MPSAGAGQSGGLLVGGAESAIPVPNTQIEVLFDVGFLTTVVWAV